MLHRGWAWLVVAPAVAVGMLSLLGSPAPAAGASTDWKIQKEDKVVTIFDAPLREETQTLATISAGTELTVLDVQGDFVSVSTSVGGETKKGWIYAKYLRTPAVLKKLTALGDDFKGYELWAKSLPTLPESVSFRRVGRPAPLGDLAVSKSGVASLQTVADPSEDKKDRAASSLESKVREYMLDRGWPRKFDSDSSYQILVACESMTVTTENSRVRATLVGNVFLLNTRSKLLLLHKQVSGEGVTEEEVYREFAREAAAEFAEIMMRWGTAPAKTSETTAETKKTTEPPKTSETKQSTQSTTTTPEPKRPPFGPPGAPPFRRPF